MAEETGLAALWVEREAIIGIDSLVFDTDGTLGQIRPIDAGVRKALAKKLEIQPPVKPRHALCWTHPGMRNDYLSDFYRWRARSGRRTAPGCGVAGRAEYPPQRDQV